MTIAASLDLGTIRAIVDRVERELGPSARAADVEREAARLLRDHALGDTAGEQVMLLDVAAGHLDSADVPLPVRTELQNGFRAGSALWIRHAMDLPCRQDDPCVQTRIDAMRHLLVALAPRQASGGLLLTVAPANRSVNLGWIPDALSSAPTLTVAVVCARPGIGLDSTILERVLDMHAALPVTDRERLSVRCARVPVARSGAPRVRRVPSGATLGTATPDQAADHLLALAASGTEASVRIDRSAERTTP